MIICDCDLVIPDIPKEECRTNVGVIVRMAFQLSGFSGFVDINELSEWLGYINGAGSDKIQISPFLNESIITAGAAITEEDNFNTVTVISNEASVFSGHIRGLSSETVTALKQYICNTPLTVYLFNERGQIIHNTGGVGVPIFAFHLEDRSNEKNTSDKNNITFQLASCWGTSLEVSNPNFDPLTDLDIETLVLTSAIVSNDNPNQVVLSYNLALDAASTPAIGDYSHNLGKSTVSVVVASNTATVTVDSAYVFGDVITIDYTAGANPIQTVGAALIADNLVGQAVVNNVALVGDNMIYGDADNMIYQDADNIIYA